MKLAVKNGVECCPCNDFVFNPCYVVSLDSHPVCDYMYNVHRFRRMLDVGADIAEMGDYIGTYRNI